jgi:RNA polymerase sigma-70 factor, ECF subfamily
MECLAETMKPETMERPVWPSPEFGRIYEEHVQAIHYLALRLLGDASLAEDATHDIFLKAFRKIGEFRGESSLRTWLYRIAQNHCLNVRQTWHQRNVVPASDEVLDEARSRDPSPLRVLETKELGQRIQATLDALSEEYRLLLLLVADEQLSYEDIGALTGQTGDSVRGKLHRARKAFHLHFQRTA